MGGVNDFKGSIMHGPWGGPNGEEWDYRLQGLTKRIKISVRYAGFVDSINFQTYLTTGETVRSFFGGNGGNRTDMICIDYPDEYLKSICVTSGHYDGAIIVMSICFVTNQNRYGPFGTNSGTVFTNDGNGGMIVGFHGRANKYLDAIGVYVMPKSLALFKDKLTLQPCSSMSQNTFSRDAGPWGVGGGKPWDDGVFSTIKQVRVHEGELNVIYAIQFEYLKTDGKSVLSKIYGGTDGVTNIKQVNLDGRDEYLTGISGFYGPVKGYDGLEAIVPITFHSNKRIHGPYGEERGAANVFFSSTPSLGKVVGFHGRSNGFLSAIGAHMEYF
ncbi:agglutinin [Helianthus annuus]|uniref:agglutinin n=1 Tax=Helianthus annuus TaxID=4232 RepID=UPI001652D4D9|nr:agglutinin [Helianthus annuus]